MKYGVGTGIANYDLVQELGFDYIELPGSQIASLTDEEFDKVKQTITNGTVKCCGFNTSLPSEIVICGDGYDLEKAKIYAELLCKRGSELGITAIGIGSPKSRKVQEGDDIAQGWKEVEAFMTMFADVAAKYNLNVLYESMNSLECTLGVKIREGADLVKKLGKSNVNLVFDIYHMSVEKESEEELIYALPYIDHVHIAECVDNQRAYPTEECYEYYKTMIGHVLKSGYDKAICTEVFAGDIREGATRTLALLKKIVSEVQ